MPADPALTLLLPADALNDSSSHQTVGGFVLEKRIGSGAMGDVYLARHGQTGQEAALKVITNKLQIDEQYLKRFTRECELLSRLNHPNIAKALDFGTDNGRPFLAMEFVRGDTLEDLLKARGKLLQTEVLHLAIQVARGLDHAFAVAGLIHRDIKPANIILLRGPDGGDSSNDQAKIIDFGLAKESSASDLHLTMTGVILGTPHYMSPEQIRCEDELTFATDLYALGATMFHLLTGRVPFPKPSPAGVLSAHLTEPVPNPSDLQPGLNPIVRQIVRRCMAKAPTERFPDWRTFIVECGKALKALGVRLDGTVHIVRRRAGTANDPATDRLTKPTVAIPSLAVSRATTEKPVESHTSRIIKKPPRESSASSGGAHQPTTATKPGTEPLALITDRIARERRPMTASEALRQVTTQKHKKLSTTQRIRRRQQMAQEMMSDGPTAPEPFPIQARTDQIRSLLPWLILGLALVGLALVIVLGN